MRPSLLQSSRDLIARAGARAGYAFTRIPDPEQILASHPDLDPAFASAYARCASFTATSPERMYAVWQAVLHLAATGVEGDIVECGVWRGGSSMLAALALAHVGDSQRRLHLYDTFAGMTEPSGRDAGPDGVPVASYWEQVKRDRVDTLILSAGLEDVRANMARTGIASERVVYVEGPVEATIPASVPERIALLRLDTDWYESTRHELEHLWPLLAVGGVLIIDDYGHWQGAREAVDEFFRDRDDAPLLCRVDYTGRMGVRTR
jgi:O-methyltransferase